MAVASRPLKPSSGPGCRSSVRPRAGASVTCRRSASYEGLGAAARAPGQLPGGGEGAGESAVAVAAGIPSRGLVVVVGADGGDLQ